MKLFISAIFMVIGFVSSVNGQTMMNTYTKCVVALENGDMDQVRSLAAVIATKKNLTRDSIEKGKKCLEAAFDEIYEYHPDYKYWVKGEKAVALTQMLATREVRNRLMRKERCFVQKFEAIEAMKKVILKDLTAENKSMIGKRTMAACIELNNTDPNAAILNPICREAFTQKLHPDLENQELLQQFQELDAEEVMASLSRLENSIELAKLDDKKLAPTAASKSVREQAFQTCE